MYNAGLLTSSLCVFQVQCVMFLLLVTKWLLLDVGHCLFELSEVMQHSVFSKLSHFSVSAMGRSSS